MNNEINLTYQIDQSKCCAKEEKWKADMIIRINEADTNANRHGSNESWKISKPPKALVDVKPQSYCPQILTIGPLYEMLGGSSSLYDCKAQCVNRFMRRHGISDVEQLMQCLFDEPCNLHTHYSGLPNYSEEALKFIVTVDTIFLNEFLIYLTTDWDSVEDYDFFFFSAFCNNGITIKQLWKDLFLMGNQIPMSFLLKLIEKFPKKLNSKDEKDELCKALALLFTCVDPFTIRHSRERQFQTSEYLDCNHLLDCLYICVLRQRSQKNKKHPINPCSFRIPLNIVCPKQAMTRGKLRERLPSASQLSKAGISFRAIEGSISVMKYEKRKLRLYLPRLVVYDYTEDTLRNLIAHEQTSKDGGELTKYAVIMDSLIDTAEDVAILTNAEVIENHLGSDEKLLKMWNDMCTTVPDGPCEKWDRMIADVLHHYHCPWRAMYVEFREKYFSRPWLTISLIVAFLLLLFSLVQTCYTVAGFYKSKH